MVNCWCQVQPGEKVLILSDERHVPESMALWRAAGHFDLVFKYPTIYADDILIMKDGFPVA